MSKPQLLVASAQTFEAAAQMISALRRFGVRAEIWRPPPGSAVGRLLMRADRLVYRRVHPRLLPEDPLPEPLLASVSSAGVTTVEATDETAVPLLATLAAAPNPEPQRRRSLRKVCDGSDPVGLFDKRWEDGLARRAGIPTPAVWSGPADVDRFPVVIKPAHGAGGEGIIRVADAASLAGLWADDGSALIQELVEGRTVNVGGVARAGSAVVISGYHGTAAKEFGPIDSVQLLDIPRAVEYARRFLAASGYTGAFCFDFIEKDGEFYFLECNARLFGSWIGLQLAGLDVVTAYAHVLGLSAAPPDAALDFETSFPVKHPSTADPRDLLRSGVARARAMRRILGPRGTAWMFIDLVAHIRRARMADAE